MTEAAPRNDLERLAHRRGARAQRAKDREEARAAAEAARKAAIFAGRKGGAP